MDTGCPENTGLREMPERGRDVTTGPATRRIAHGPEPGIPPLSDHTADTPAHVIDVVPSQNGHRPHVAWHPSGHVTRVISGRTASAGAEVAHESGGTHGVCVTRVPIT
ncbi:hypothetical protein SSPO_091940 [Streptomyces antimycoticus]|uniref:Uncharacterized protein n=1 Tax=Streptomyces antimycoticus TaxID=68175 RepID=A0A499VE55_9ACTN|nr:hypothetical protein SSPO_091940 [Streptomyces antimycoticus]